MKLNECLGKVILVPNSDGGLAELTVIELSPSKDYVKIQTEDGSKKLWVGNEEIKVIEVLRDAPITR